MQAWYDGPCEWGGCDGRSVARSTCQAQVLAGKGGAWAAHLSRNADCRSHGRRQRAGGRDGQSGDLRRLFVIADLQMRQSAIRRLSSTTEKLEGQNPPLSCRTSPPQGGRLAASA